MINENDFMNEINAEREKREQVRNKNAPICSNSIHILENGKVEKECETKTQYENTCGGYVCPNCNTHYSTLGSRMNYCWCGWNKQNFDPMYAGETW